jgi:hypothetical protein
MMRGTSVCCEEPAMFDGRWLTMIFGALTVTFAITPSTRAGESSGRVAQGILFCQAWNNQKRLYVSDVFTVDDQQGTLDFAWRQFLLTKYHVQDSTSCGGAVQGEMTEAQARAYQKQQWARNRAGGFEVIETGWKFAAAEAGQRFAHICTANAARWTGTRAQHVFARATNPVEIPASAEVELYQAWSAQLKQGHPELDQVQAGCIRMVPEDAAARQKRLQAMDQESAGPQSGWELIHVPFSFTPSEKAP